MESSRKENSLESSRKEKNKAPESLLQLPDPLSVVAAPGLQLSGAEPDGDLPLRGRDRVGGVDEIPTLVKAEVPPDRPRRTGKASWDVIKPVAWGKFLYGGKGVLPFMRICQRRLEPSLYPIDGGGCPKTQAIVVKACGGTVVGRWNEPSIPVQPEEEGAELTPVKPQAALFGLGPCWVPLSGVGAAEHGADVGDGLRAFPDARQHGAGRHRRYQLRVVGSIWQRMVSNSQVF